MTKDMPVRGYSVRRANLIGNQQNGVGVRGSSEVVSFVAHIHEASVQFRSPLLPA